MSEKNHIDKLILIPVLILIGIGFGVVYSASTSWSAKFSGDSMLMFKNHAARALLGIICIFVFARIDYKKITLLRKFLIFLVIAMLFYLLVAEVEAKKGAARWIQIAGVKFQPSEFVKYVLVLNIAYLLAEKKNYLLSLYYSYLPMLAYVVIVTVLIALQPNISTAIMIFATCMSLFFIGGVKIKHLAFTILSFLPAAVLYVFSKAYALNRIFSYSESVSGEDSNYQLTQAIIGFGNGFIFGTGPGNSNQKEFYLPQSYDDFVFAILGEEYGYLGTLLVISMFALLIYRGYRTSKKCSEDTGKYLAFGITTVIALNAVVNMMVSTGILPTTGVTLPFISYGGTSIVFNSIAIGMLLNISQHTNSYQPVWSKISDEKD